jgi:hypothetical protein
VAVLVGDQYLNPDYFLWNTKERHWIEWTNKTIKEYNPKSFARTDGTVSYISASQPPLPKDVIVKEYKARNNGPGKGSHRELMNEVDMIDVILKDLQQSHE